MNFDKAKQLIVMKFLENYIQFQGVPRIDEAHCLFGEQVK